MERVENMKRAENVEMKRKKQEQEELRVRIRRFDSAFVSYGNSMQQLAAYLFEGVVLILMMLPYQIYGEEPFLMFMTLMFLPYPGMFYVMAYLTFSESKKTHTIYEKIKYAPFDVKQLRRVRVEYLVRFLKKTFWLALGAQLLAALLIYHRITVLNILYVFLAAGVWPFLANYAIICQNTRRPGRFC